MAAIVLKDCKVWVDNTADDTDDPSVPMTSKTEITGLSSISLEDSADTPEVTTFGDSARRHLPGLTDANGSIEAVIDTAANANHASLDAVYAKRRLWVVSPYGKGGTGNAFTATEPGYAFNATLTSRPFVTGAVGDAARQTLNFKVDGKVVLVESGTV